MIPNPDPSAAQVDETVAFAFALGFFAAVVLGFAAVLFFTLLRFTGAYSK